MTFPTRLSRLVKRGPDTPAYQAKKPKSILSKWRNGGDGFVKWCEDMEVRIPIYEDGLPIWRSVTMLSDEPHPITKRRSTDMWQEQCRIAREALEMKNGEFVHRLIVFCWMRGESKSLLVCLIVLWKFFTFASQKFMLGANSKDQSKFVHFDIMRDIILNTPKLLGIVGERNIQEKEIRLKNKLGRVVSIIRSVSSFSGILSNISGYTFSEMFDMKNPKFFTQIDGSIRNVPNAFGLIDSTVSTKQHILYQLYTSWRTNKDETIYFSHRQSKDADSADFWNPNMTQSQLDSYRSKFPENEFAQYFRNTWEAGSDRLFSVETILGMQYLGIGNSLGETFQIQKILKNCDTILNNENLPKTERIYRSNSLKAPLIHISKVYNLKTPYLQPRPIAIDELEKLGTVYDTDWAIITGADRADPMKIDQRHGARTIITAVAKGLPGSRTSPMAHVSDAAATKYIYFLIHLIHILHSDLDTIKETLERLDDELDGISTFCSERWGMWDIGSWCEEKDIQFEAVTASYNKQREAFSELYNLIKGGRFKAPPLAVKGSKQDDILIEELGMFDHNKAKKWYGSPEKSERKGIQDDTIFSIGWAVYGGRMLTVDDFRTRSAYNSFGEFYKGRELVGKY